MGNCKLCGKRRKVLSQRKLCEKCSKKVMENTVAQMRAKNGPYYDKWKEGMLRYLKKSAKAKKKS
ncbi:unnamed protein product [marine sediment metagenome]|uniref:Uncharacterized protein n=1 Tax=marine sediment metagenome TaxID=412755 RepID=X1MPY4_9ZZZZ